MLMSCSISARPTHPGNASVSIETGYGFPRIAPQESHIVEFPVSNGRFQCRTLHAGADQGKLHLRQVPQPGSSLRDCVEASG